MNNKDLAFVFLLSTIGLVFVALKFITKVLFEWGVAYIAFIAVLAVYVIKFLLTVL